MLPRTTFTYKYMTFPSLYLVESSISKQLSPVLQFVPLSDSLPPSYFAMATSTSTPNPILADKLEALAQRLHATAQDLRSGSISLETDANQRMGMIKAGAELVDAVSKPWDKILNWIPQFAQAAAVRLFIKWGVFQNIPTGNGESISYEDLAAKVGAEVSLISKSRSSSVVLVINPDPSLIWITSPFCMGPCIRRSFAADRNGSRRAYSVLRDVRHSQSHASHGGDGVRHPSSSPVCSPRIVLT
ncbi:hypothetical protein QBC33DRAFT_212787 [Phialemonium atrogriseum]|uniref:Uncharacterized protein n=1 Tax=Phialemonium atrogriseum TaxID=1093897 RepID=A0AAJ0BTE3_9PEZI|nr:uncharacterized protein QBC33DRAFT_212787 [Phialemonium atrogriseum]KAK1763876.1 hypothetical protein QBC33DRAFT_212787 [Phialemonium atrogriseum]